MSSSNSSGNSYSCNGDSRVVLTVEVAFAALVEVAAEVRVMEA